MEYSQPHVIAFLGDLMDEGHVANAEDFEKYKRRLDSIFATTDDIMVYNMIAIYFFSFLVKSILYLQFILFCLENLLAR